MKKGMITECSLKRDVQADTTGFRNIPIQKVGVRNIKVPFTLLSKDGGDGFRTIATVSSNCSLDENTKGINMSRISRTINDVLEEGDGNFGSLEAFVFRLRDSHRVENVDITAKFDYIIKSKSPMSGLMSYEPVVVEFSSELIDGELQNYITVESVEMSLCPCSKDMSLLTNNLTEAETTQLYGAGLSPKLYMKINEAGFGAHNQKSRIKVKVALLDSTLWIESLVDIIKLGASSPTWTTLKRVDEKFVTEVSYLGGYFDDDGEFNKVEGAGPKFVEDISRDIAHQLNEILDDWISSYTIEVENEESIHSGELVAVAFLSSEG